MDGVVIAAVAALALIWLVIRCREVDEQQSRLPRVVLQHSDSSDAVERVRAQSSEHSRLDHPVQDDQRSDREENVDEQHTPDVVHSASVPEYDVQPSVIVPSMIRDVWR